MRLAAKFVVLGVVAGPVGVVVWLLWCREEKMLSEAEDEEASKRI